MQFVDLQTQYERIEDDIFERLGRVLHNQKFIMGPEVFELESRLAELTGTKHVLTCASGTDALTIPLMAYGLCATDAVFVPSFTFFASAECVTLAGGTPVFIDSDPLTFNICTKSLRKIIDRTIAEGKLNPKGIIAVDLFGLPADYDEIEILAKEYNLFLIEDAAQSFGSEYKGRRAGSIGNAAATSFFPSKPLGCYGDGGAIFTNDDNLSEIMASIRIHGQGVDKYDNVRIGLNGRFDTIQAAVVLAKLKVFKDEITSRNRIAAAYSERLSDILITPLVPEGLASVWAQYTLVAQNAQIKEQILGSLEKKGIPTAVYYRVPIHLSTAYTTLGYKEGDLPVCEDLSKRVFSLPMHPYLSDEDIEIITSTIRKCYE